MGNKSKQVQNEVTIVVPIKWLNVRKKEYKIFIIQIPTTEWYSTKGRYG